MHLCCNFYSVKIVIVALVVVSLLLVRDLHNGGRLLFDTFLPLRIVDGGIGRPRIARLKGRVNRLICGFERFPAAQMCRLAPLCIDVAFKPGVRASLVDSPVAIEVIGHRAVHLGVRSAKR